MSHTQIKTSDSSIRHAQVTPDISGSARPAIQRSAPTLETFFEDNSKQRTTIASMPHHAESAKEPAPQQNTAKHSIKKFIQKIEKKHFIVSLAVILITITGYAAIDALLINHEARANQLTSAPATDKKDQSQPQHPVIDETPPKPDVVSSYKVAGDLPRLISIDSLGVKARVLRMAIGSDGALETPKNSFDTGWYDGSAKPGEAGAMLINGHYSGLTSPGVFHGLEKLTAGSIITVEKGDGTVLKFAVTSVEKMPSGDVPMNQLLISSKPGVQSLNLITCSGTFDAKNQTYDKRVVVRASAV